MQNINFSHLRGDGEVREVSLTGLLGVEIDQKAAGQVTLSVTGIDPSDGNGFETIVDLQVTQARIIAAAIIAMADYVETRDRAR